MAGISLGAFSPSSLAPGADLQRFPQDLPPATRKRRTHGVCMLGSELATVTSSRQESDSLGVTLSLASGSMMLRSSMTPCQARAMARALQAAAFAAEATQQNGASRAAMAARIVPAKSAAKLSSTTEGGAA